MSKKIPVLVLVAIVAVIGIGAFVMFGGQLPGTTGTPATGTSTSGASGTSISGCTRIVGYDTDGSPIGQEVPCEQQLALSIFKGQEGVSGFDISTSVTATDTNFDSLQIISAGTTPAVIYDTFKNGAATPTISGPIAKGSTFSWTTLKTCSTTAGCDVMLGCSLNTLTCDNGEIELRFSTLPQDCKCKVGAAQFEALPQPVAFTVNVEGKYTYASVQNTVNKAGSTSATITPDPTGGFTVSVGIQT